MVNSRSFRWVSICLTGILAGASSLASGQSCTGQSGLAITPVIELYTSEGCSSCPPADRWLSGLKSQPSIAARPVVQAFHVGYWDYIGWVDRFASPAHTERQRQVAKWNRQRSIYTPQAVLNGQDWRGWGSGVDRVPTDKELAHVSITLRQSGPDQFEAQIRSDQGAPALWSAYWTVTEHGHSSKVKAGENSGELLQHDFVVRQYTLAGEYRSTTDGPQRLSLRTIAPSPGHARQVNIVVFDPATGRTLQAVSADC